MDFYHLQENIKNSYLIHDSLKTASKKVVQKAGEIADADKIADSVTKLNGDKLVKQEPAEDIIIPLEKRDKKLNKLGIVL